MIFSANHLAGAKPGLPN